jgi:hypothetical protein
MGTIITTHDIVVSACSFPTLAFLLQTKLTHHGVCVPPAIDAVLVTSNACHMDIGGSVNVTSATRLAQLWVQDATSFSVSGDVTVSGALYNTTGGELAFQGLSNGFALFNSVAKVRSMLLLVLSSLWSSHSTLQRLRLNTTLDRRRPAPALGQHVLDRRHAARRSRV